MYTATWQYNELESNSTMLLFGLINAYVSTEPNYSFGAGTGNVSDELTEREGERGREQVRKRERGVSMTARLLA